MQRSLIAPLRRVLEVGPFRFGARKEQLECGHVFSACLGFHRPAKRRRCELCLRGEKIVGGAR